tara:strand:- start:87 stop:680 length:594 start_codon:yes stop_codon:yes gene_type:complete
MPTLPLPYSVPGRQSLLETRESDRGGDVTRAVNALGLTLPGSSIEEIKSEDNVFLLGSGPFGGPTLTKPYTHLGGLPGTRVTRQLLLEEKAIIDGITFENAPSSAGTLIKVRDTGVVLFRNCIFDNNLPDGSKVWIALESGARCVFLGCLWRGGDGAGGTLVNNAGVAANVHIAGCISGPTAPGAAFVNCSAPVASL